MNNQEWEEKVDLLKERVEKLLDSWKLEANARIEEYKSLREAIGDCLSILETAREERSITWALLELIYNLEWRFAHWMPPYRPLVDSLNRFVVAYEDWRIVESYAKEETVDFDLHAMAVMARQIICIIEGKRFEINSKLREPPTSGQFIVHSLETYSSAFGLKQGVHFFEMVVLECSHWGWAREFKIGWATRLLIKGEKHRIDENNWLQSKYDPIDDQHFLGFHNLSFPSGTVLGCLLNFTQRTFAFYVNGRKVMEKLPKECPFSSSPYYVQAMGDALLYCNFGQVPFKYPPPQISDYPTTDLAGQIKRYALYGRVECMPLFDNQVGPVFTDAKQRKVMETLKKLWNEGRITKENVAEKYRQLWKEETFHRETYGWRWLQAILELENVDDGKVNEWAILVVALVHCIEDIMWYYFENFLVPYTKLRSVAGDRSTMYRTLAIFFATLLQYREYSRINLGISSRFFSSFLLSAFLSTTDPSTAMFTLIGLEMVKKEEGIENPIMQKLRNKEFTEKQQEWKGIIKNTGKSTGKSNHFFAQLHLVIQHFEHSLLSSSALGPATATTLSPSACSSQAKLSADCLSLRSDYQWQSACSHLSVDNLLSLPSPLFYFEATLLTSGAMRFGWATQRWQVEGNKLGNNEFSFGYDGATGCIWHQDVQWRIKDAKKWQAGDVIGCLLDLSNQQFTFYQNGEAIELNGDIYSRVSKKIQFPARNRMVHVYERNDSLKSITPFISMHPYHAALSLGPYQQVTVNFGHTFFRFPPKCLDFWDFQQYSEHLKVHEARLKLNQFSIGSATNAVITIGGKTTTENISINQSVAPSNLKTRSSFIIREPTFCQLCKQKTNYRRRTLEGCPHLAFCVDCSSKDLICRECPQ